MRWWLFCEESGGDEGLAALQGVGNGYEGALMMVNSLCWHNRGIVPCDASAGCIRKRWRCGSHDTQGTLSGTGVFRTS